MGWIQVINTKTNEIELEVGVRPDIYEADDYINPISGEAFNSKPKPVYREFMKEDK